MKGCKIKSVQFKLKLLDSSEPMFGINTYINIRSEKIDIIVIYSSCRLASDLSWKGDKLSKTEKNYIEKWLQEKKNVDLVEGFRDQFLEHDFHSITSDCYTVI